MVAIVRGSDELVPDLGRVLALGLMAQATGYSEESSSASYR
ncbi:hypothetical protein [Arthrobacter sp. Soil736]|nr:hypothetical protein [Arthrobacter sp. Soil736]